MYDPSPSTSLSGTSTLQTANTIRVKPVESSLQKISVASFFFQLALILYCIAHCISLSELSYIDTFSTITRLLQYCTLGFLLIKVLLFSRYSIFEIAIYLIFCVIAALGAYSYGNNELIYLALFIVGAKEVNVRTICKTVLPTIVICAVGIILLSLAGAIGNRTAYSVNQLTDETVYRQAFGFTHYNNLGRISLAAFACYLYLRYKRFNILDICLTLAWSALLYFVVSSKTAPIVMIAAIILVLLSKMMPFRGLIIICAIICIACIVGSLLISYFYDASNAFMAQINTWLSGRVRYAHYFFENYSITLFGQSIDFGERGTSSRLILDNAYVSLLFRYGIVNFIAIIAVYAVAFVKSCQKSRPSVIIILTVILAAGFAEYWIYLLPGIIALSIAFGKHPNEQSKYEKITNQKMNDYLIDSLHRFK